MFQGIHIYIKAPCCCLNFHPNNRKSTKYAIINRVCYSSSKIFFPLLTCNTFYTSTQLEHYLGYTKEM